MASAKDALLFVLLCRSTSSESAKTLLAAWRIPLGLGGGGFERPAAQLTPRPCGARFLCFTVGPLRARMDISRRCPIPKDKAPSLQFECHASSKPEIEERFAGHSLFACAIPTEAAQKVANEPAKRT